jgi:predicted small lipoprotein YifL
MKNVLIGAVLGVITAVVLAACGGTGTLLNPPSAGVTTPQYKQIELLSRPAVKEAFETFADHDTTNRTEPYNDPTLKSQIGSFTTSVAGRSAANASALQSILYPNEMKADLSSSATKAAYLGVESGGATGSTFGGRALSDDVIDISLGAIFGNTLSALGVVPDDGKESPCLTTDHVSYQSTTQSTFPYTQGPL